MKEHKDLKEEQIRQELISAGLENDLTKAETAEAKAGIVFNAVRTLFYSLGQVANVSSLGLLGSVRSPIGFMR